MGVVNNFATNSTVNLDEINDNNWTEIKINFEIFGVEAGFLIFFDILKKFKQYRKYYFFYFILNHKISIKSLKIESNAIDYLPKTIP